MPSPFKRFRGLSVRGGSGAGRGRRSRHPVAEFQRAHAFWHFRAYEQAIGVLEDLIFDHPRHPVTELGGALLIDSLAQTKRISQLRMWLDLVWHIEGFLDDKPQLRAIVRDHRRRYDRAGLESSPSAPPLGDRVRNENRLELSSSV